MGKFRFLKFGLGLVLAFVGAKMLISDIVHVPIGVSLGVVAGLLACSIGASLLFPEKGPGTEDAPKTATSQPTGSEVM